MDRLRIKLMKVYSILLFLEWILNLVGFITRKVSIELLCTLFDNYFDKSRIGELNTIYLFIQNFYFISINLTFTDVK